MTRRSISLASGSIVNEMPTRHILSNQKRGGTTTITTGHQKALRSSNDFWHFGGQLWQDLIIRQFSFPSFHFLEIFKNSGNINFSIALPLHGVLLKFTNQVSCKGIHLAPQFGGDAKGFHCIRCSLVQSIYIAAPKILAGSR